MPAKHKETIIKQGHKISRLQAERDAFKKAFQSQGVGYIITAFGLVAGLAWNEAIKTLIVRIFPLESDGLAAKFGYAIAVTLIAIVAAVYLGRISKKD